MFCCLPRWSTRSSTSTVLSEMIIITRLLFMTMLTSMRRTTSARPKCLPSTLRWEEETCLHCARLPFSWIVRRVFISRQVQRHALSNGACCVSTEVCCVNSSVLDETSVSLCCLLDLKKCCAVFFCWPSVSLPTRRRTPSPFWLLPLSATLRCCPSTRSYESKQTSHNPNVESFIITWSVLEKLTWGCFFFSLFFAGHYSSATKKRMQGVANISIMAMFVMYLLTALFGYLTFYGKILLSSLLTEWQDLHIWILRFSAECC